MAKRVNETGPSDKAKVRVLFAEVEGNNDSVQEALRTMVAAMTRPVRVITEQQLQNGKTQAVLGQVVDPESQETLDGALDDDAREQEQNPPAEARKPRGTGKKSDRNAGLELIPNLNFRPDGHQTMREFVASKNAESDVDVVVASVYYMRRMMQLPKVNASHVLSAFRELNKPVPVDLKQTIRNIKKNKIYLDFEDIFEDIRITSQGDNHVEHDMGKGA